MKIKTGDTVVVIDGEQRSTKGNIVKGEVLKVFPKETRIIVENVNMLTKHQKPQGPNMPGGIIKFEGPIHVSKVALFCKKCDRGVRVGYDVLKDGSKVRVCKSCGEVLDK